MLAEPELTRDDRLASCSGVTLMPLTPTSWWRADAPIARLATNSRSDADVLAFVVHRPADQRKRVATTAVGGENPLSVHEFRRSLAA
jgi:hypothetical protein